MPTLKIKRGTTTPTSLVFGELGFNDTTNDLFVGKNNGTVYKFTYSTGSTSAPTQYVTGTNWNELNSTNNRLNDIWFWDNFNWVKKIEERICFDPALIYSATSGRWCIFQIPSTITAIYPGELLWNPNLLGVNDASNYWTAQFTVDSSNLFSVNTSTQTTGNFKRITSQFPVTGYGPGWTSIGVSFSKVGSPGNLQPGAIVFSGWIAR
jgi:hypothetical protein